MRDAMSWSVIIKNHCKNVTINNIKIIGQWRYNTDGINICASQNVIVRNSFIRSFDDCFIARGAYIYGETENLENLLVENCVMWCDWGKALEIWCGNRSCVIRNVSYKNIYLIHLTHVAIAISTKYGSECALVENLSYDNIYIDGEENYREPQIESLDNLVYAERTDFVPFILSIGAADFGRATGNQSFEPAEDLSGYHLVYRNISLRNVRHKGKALRVWVKPIDNVLEIENVSVKDCDIHLCDKDQSEN